MDVGITIEAEGADDMLVHVAAHACVEDVYTAVRAARTGGAGLGFVLTTATGGEELNDRMSLLVDLGINDGCRLCVTIPERLIAQSRLQVAGITADQATLDRAAAANEWETVRLILAAELVVPPRACLLVSAAAAGDAATVALLLAQSVDVGYAKSGVTALRAAVENGRLGIVEQLLQQGADINGVDRKGRSALMLAVAQGDGNMAKVLLDGGALVNLPGRRSQSALTLAIAGGEVQLVDLLLARGADVDFVGFAQQTPLLVAARHRQHRIALRLLKAGARVNCRDRNGMTPFLWTVVSGETDDPDLLEDYRECGADVAACDVDGDTALFYAARARRPRMVAYLVARGVDAAARNASDETAFHVCVRTGDFLVLKELLATDPPLPLCVAALRAAGARRAPEGVCGEILADHIRANGGEVPALVTVDVDTADARGAAAHVDPTPEPAGGGGGTEESAPAGGVRG